LVKVVVFIVLHHRVTIFRLSPVQLAFDTSQSAFLVNIPLLDLHISSAIVLRGLNIIVSFFFLLLFFLLLGCLYIFNEISTYEGPDIVVFIIIDGKNRVDLLDSQWDIVIHHQIIWVKKVCSHKMIVSVLEDIMIEVTLMH
jgi:hypothetical protein